jgi:hypothetical protein
MSAYRPKSVVAIAILFILISILGFLVEIMEPNTTNPGNTNTMLTYIYLLSLVGANPSFNILISTGGATLASFFLLMLFINISDDISSLISLPSLVLSLEVLSRGYLISAIGLLYMKKWGRWLGFIMASILIAGSKIAILTLTLAPIGALGIALAIVVIVYLDKLKNEFK